MADKELHTLKEIAIILGVHKNTIRKKVKKYSFYFIKEQRKHFYNQKEVAFIKSLFQVD